MTLLAGDSTIETERLVLRPIARDDLPFFTRIHADPDVARYIGYGRPRTVDESRRWLDAILDGYASHQLGQLAVTRKTDGALLGRCGIAFLEIDEHPDDGGDPLGWFAVGEAPAGRPTQVIGELGYTFDRAAWGQGFAREAARASHRYAITRRRMSAVGSLIRPENARSVKLATSFGATRMGRVRAFGGLEFDHYAWPIADTV